MGFVPSLSIWISVIIFCSVVMGVNLSLAISVEWTSWLALVCFAIRMGLSQVLFSFLVVSMYRVWLFEATEYGSTRMENELGRPLLSADDSVVAV